MRAKGGRGALRIYRNGGWLLQEGLLWRESLHGQYFWKDKNRACPLKVAFCVLRARELFFFSCFGRLRGRACASSTPGGLKAGLSFERNFCALRARGLFFLCCFGRLRGVRHFRRFLQPPDASCPLIERKSARWHCAARREITERSEEAPGAIAAQPSWNGGIWKALEGWPVGVEVYDKPSGVVRGECRGGLGGAAAPNRPPSAPAGGGPN